MTISCYFNVIGLCLAMLKLLVIQADLIIQNKTVKMASNNCCIFWRPSLCGIRHFYWLLDAQLWLSRLFLSCGSYQYQIRAMHQWYWLCYATYANLTNWTNRTNLTNLPIYKVANTSITVVIFVEVRLYIWISPLLMWRILFKAITASVEPQEQFCSNCSHILSSL